MIIRKLTKPFLLVSMAFSLSSCSILLPMTDAPFSSSRATAIGEPLTPKAIDAYLITPALLKRLSPEKSKARINSALEKEIRNYQYVVGIADVLNITVWDHPELTTPAGTYRSAAESGNQVHSNGTIFYPYVGTVKVAGLTVSQIRQKLTEQLAAYIEDPQIDVNVASFQSKKAYITGEVKTPGQQYISNVPLTLLDAVNKAGGLNSDADWYNVTLTRKGKEEIISLQSLIQRGDLTQNRLLRDGDIVHIPRNDGQKVFVMGEVATTQLLTIGREGMTLTEAISASGGIDKLSSDATGIFVIRSKQRGNTLLKNPKQPEKADEKLEKVADVYQLNVSNATAYVLGTEFFLRPYDVVYVTTAPVSRWDRVISQVLPTISGFDQLTQGALRVRTWP